MNISYILAKYYKNLAGYDFDFFNNFLLKTLCTDLAVKDEKVHVINLYFTIYY